MARGNCVCEIGQPLQTTRMSEGPGQCLLHGVGDDWRGLSTPERVCDRVPGRTKASR